MIPFKVVGVGPGHRDYLLPVALKAIREADLLIGACRILDEFRDEGKEVFPYHSNLSELLDFLEKNRTERQIAVLVSGDPGYHSLLNAVSSRFPEDAYEVIPGISSFQVAMARRGKSWQDDLLVSCHGQDFGEIIKDVLNALEAGRRVILLTDHRWNPGAVSGELLAAGSEFRRVWLAESLTAPEESFTETTLEALNGNREEYRLCVMIIE